MCGIFGFILSKPQPVNLALEVLKLLEKHQYRRLNETNPVGGHGAGIYFLTINKKELVIKFGKTIGSPAEALSEKISKMQFQARLLIGHVRRASQSFLNTISFKECTQPYVAACGKHLKIISVHNGFMENYKELRLQLRLKHCFESEEKGELIDSEVLPHFLEELLLNKVSINEALNLLFLQFEKQKQGGNTVGMLLFGKRKTDNRLVLMHHGRTRGLTIWTNPSKEVIFSSRKEPVKTVLGNFLKKYNFRETISIGWKESQSLKPLIFSLPQDIVN